LFNRRKHYYFLSMQNIKRPCFTALDSSITDAFKVSNDPTVQGWHAGMRVIDILDQLSLIYGQPTPTALDANNHIFRSPTSAADAPEVLFRRIKNMHRGSVARSKSLHRQATDQQHNPPPPNHGFIYMHVQRLGPAG